MTQAAVPQQLKYTKEHEWVKVEGNKATVGITAYAQSELGDVVFADLPAVGKSCSPGQSVANVESVKAVSDIYSPLSGKVTLANDAVKNKPELINTDPYGQGWLFQIEISNEAEVKNLLSADDYQALINEIAK